MNDSIQVPLKILIERAVRPVRATIGRKRKMREELMAHLTTVFAEEAKLADEQTALERTRLRFGDPDELARQLQAALPASDRIGAKVEALIGFPPSGSKLLLASRHAVLVALMMTVALMLMMGLMILITGQWSEWLTLKRLPAILAPVNFAVLTFGASLLGQGMTQALFGPAGRSWPRIVGLCIAAWLLMPTVIFICCFGFTGDFATSFLDVLPLLFPGLLAPLVLMFVVIVSNAEIRHCAEWASLPIGAESRRFT